VTINSGTQKNPPNSVAPTAADHAEQARTYAAQAAASSTAAQTAQQITQAQAAGLSGEPGWIYAMVIGILGVALIALVIAMVISSLRGSGTISTDIVSAATLIIGGLIGVLAPSPTAKKPSQKSGGNANG
jgi:hypothetical protein